MLYFFFVWLCIHFRAHYSFVEDSLDSYIVGACMHLLNISDIDDELARKQPLFEILSKEDHHRYIYSLAKEITDNKERLSYEAI